MSAHSSRTVSGSAVPAEQEALEECLAAMLNSPTSHHFSVADYLNTALAASSEQQQEQEEESKKGEQNHENELQRRMAELALQLQLQTQSCHEDIGRIGAELQAVLPRCSADVGRVSVGLRGLQSDAESLLEQSTTTATNNNEENTTNDVSSSLQTLSTLHALQSGLRRTHEILTAAATWDETLESVAPLLAQSNNQDLPRAVAALTVLQKGERALRGMPHAQERVDALARARQQVSTLLQPQLNHALAVLPTRLLTPLQQCVEMYQQLEQMPTLIDEYVKHRPAGIHKAWFEYTPPTNITTSTTTASNDGATSTEFMTWLPGWLDAVLTLISEERRQSTTIFGPELVPEIVVKVFRECFRPILPSFKSRLSSIYSSDPTGPKKGSLQSISTIYESMLQFLSLAYENIAGGWIDMVEAGTIPASQGPRFYKELMNTFVFVASPFADYQKSLAELESRYLGEQAQQLAKQLHQATATVSGASTSLEVLQQATDRLQELSIAVFPLAEGAVARFELLKGGYGATSALSAMDHVLAGHAGELAIATHKLSAAMTSDEQVLADKFDEPHVLCALQVLKVAGNFQRYMRALEGKTRERLVLLSERVAAQSSSENALKDAYDKTVGGVGGKSSFQVSDSMNAVEIDSLITKAVCIESDEEFDSAFASLQRLATQEEEPPAVLYPDVGEASKRLANSCHTFVYDVCASVPRLYLAGMSSMVSWREESGAEAFASYGTLPQEYITAVGEHMLALVQALEPFATDKEALSLANEVMDGVRRVAQQPWLDFIVASGSVASERVVCALMDGKDIAHLVVGDVVQEDDDEDDEEEEDEETKAVTAFCNAWLDVVGLAVTGRLLERIMRIPVLTPKGCEHLNADLGYLVNVLSALGVAGHPHPLLGHIGELAAADTEILAQHIDSLDRNDEMAALLRSVEERLAGMRSKT